MRSMVEGGSRAMSESLGVTKALDKHRQKNRRVATGFLASVLTPQLTDPRLFAGPGTLATLTAAAIRR